MDLYCYIKVLKVKPVYQQMTLSTTLVVLEISTPVVNADVYTDSFFPPDYQGLEYPPRFSDLIC